MIGILGGMGPESTAYTYMRIIRRCQQQYGAKLDSDFPPIIIYSMPIPDVVEEGCDDREVLALLDSGVRKLEAAGAAFSFIACNTMQGFVPELRKRYRMLSLVEETLMQAKQSGLADWGILGTEVTMRKGYYQQAFNDAGLRALTPSSCEQAEVTAAIREILAGTDVNAPRKRLKAVAGALADRGARGVVLACTDLPLALGADDAGMIVLDTADISAKAALLRWRRERGLGGDSPF